MYKCWRTFIKCFLVAVPTLLEFSLRPEATLALVTGSPYPLAVLLLGDSDGYFICVLTHDTVPRGWLHIQVGHVLSGCLQVRWGPTVVGTALTVLIHCAPQGSHHCTITRISSGLGCTGRGTGRFLPLWFRAGPSLQCQFRHVLIALYRAVFTPNLNLLGVDMCSLVALISECTAGRVVPPFLHGADNESGEWASNWGSANKGDILQGRHWKKWSPSLMSWTVWGGPSLWALWLRYSSSHLNVLFSSCCGGQHFVNVARGNCRAGAPGQQLDSVSWAFLREDLLEGGVYLFGHLGLLFFHASWLTWSTSLSTS